MSNHGEVHSDSYYIKIWGGLLVLLIISLIGPELGYKWVTLITAFGIAIVKAYIVMSFFMHLNVEKKIVLYMLAMSVILMFVCFIGLTPDILKNNGTNWEKCVGKPTCIELRYE